MFPLILILILVILSLAPTDDDGRVTQRSVETVIIWMDGCTST